MCRRFGSIKAKHLNLCGSVERHADFLVNSTVVVQTIAQDSVLRRSSMAAAGSLVHGYLQQIKRCDLPLGEAWYASVGGPTLTEWAERFAGGLYAGHARRGLPTRPDPAGERWVAA